MKRSKSNREAEQDRKWSELFAQHPEVLEKLVRKAMSDYRRGRTKILKCGNDQ
jgi:hypothetical protein